MDKCAEADASRDPWAPERAVRALLETYKVDVSAMPPEAFVLVVAQIDKFKSRPNDKVDGRPLRRPVTGHDMAEMKRLALEQKKNRRALNLAANILQWEMDKGKWRAIPGFKEHVCRWDEAIAILRMPRGAIDNPHDWLHVASNGPAMRPWSYMATEIAGMLVQVLKGYGVAASLRHTSAVAKFTLEALRFVGEKKLPAITTLSKVLQKNLAGIKKP